MRHVFAGIVAFFVCLASLESDGHADFLYTDFSSTAGLQLNADAHQAGNVLRLSNSASFSSGSVFTSAQVDLRDGNSFSTHFQFRLHSSAGIGDEDGIGADGLVFIVQPVGNNVGGAGFGIGYSGIAQSLGVEFDTYNNGASTADPSDNHVGIDLNGNIASVQTRTEAIRFNNEQVWNAWIDYDGLSDALEIRWSMVNSRPEESQLSRTVDLESVIGQSTAYVGFTSATGSGFNDHDLLRWEFRGEFAPIPEPASLPGIALLTTAIIFFSRVFPNALD